MAFVLGITGGIASGKSSVARLLASYCLAPLIDVDDCCRQLLERGQEGWQALHAAFGPAFEQADGSIDRRGLRRALFADDDLRRRVDSLVHPLALVCTQEAIQSHGKDVELILVEIPLLYEAGWQTQVDAVLVVFLRPEVQCCRLMQRDRIDAVQAGQALAAQMDLAQKAARADYVIDNSGDWHQTRRAVIALGERLCGPSVVGKTNNPEKVLDRTS